MRNKLGSRAPQNESGPAGQIGATRNEPGPHIMNRGRATWIMAPQDGSRPRGTNQGTGRESGLARRTRAP